MIIFILLFLLTKWQLILLSAQRIGRYYLALNLTQRVTLEYDEYSKLV